MKNLSKHLYKTILVIVFSMPLLAQAALPNFTEIVDQAKDSVVNISTKTKARPSSSTGRLRK